LRFRSLTVPRRPHRPPPRRRHRDSAGREL